MPRQPTYDAFGERVATTENGFITTYVVDPVGIGNLVAEYSNSHNLIARYDYSFGLLSQIDVSGNPTYYTFDAMGNAQQMVTDIGIIANTYTYTPFGKSLQRTESIPNTFEFVGQLGVTEECAGLSFMRNRFYSQDLGRYLSEDLLAKFGSGTDVYTYVTNEPTAWVDPCGTWKAPFEWADQIDRWIDYAHEYYSKESGSQNWVSQGLIDTSFDIIKIVSPHDALRLGTGSPLENVKRIADVVSFFSGPLSALTKEAAWLRYLNRGGDWTKSRWSKAYDVLSRTWHPIRDLVGESVDFARDLVDFLNSLDYDRLYAIANTRIQTSISPEDKFGPAGYDVPDTPAGSEQRFLVPGQTFAYRIEMWNKPEAPVPTQDATIYDILDPDVFDLSTFEFTRVGFLKWDVPLPGGQAVDVRVDCRPDMNIAVDITGTLDPATGRIDWWFHTVDPITGDYPDDPMAGFLPPFNPETKYEIGWMEYTVKVKDNLATGTVIANQAFVQFDFLGPWGPAPKAGPWINTIDTGTPTSSVAPLPAEIDAAQFTVSWSGQDDENGSGIASYDIYVSDNSGVFALWLDDTTQTSATSAGQNGHTYAFHSIATDNVGHVEASPLVPDAQTTILLNEPPVAAAGGPYTVAEGESVLLDASGTTDPDLPDDVLTYDWDFDGDGEYDDATGIHPTFSAVLLDGPDSKTVGLKVTDSYGESDTDTATVQVVNVAPSVAADNAIVSVDEGQTVANTGTYSDPGDDTVTLTASVGTILDNGDGTWDWLFGTSDGPDESQVVVITATDSDNAETTTTFGLVVNNVAPSLVDATFEVDENSPNGTVVGMISGSDPGDDQLTYSIVGGSGATAFAIDADSGQITVADETQLDYETTLFFTLEVQVADDDNATDNATVTIDLLNQASITGVVFVDVNENEVYEANEPGIDGITIELLDENGVPVLDSQNNPVTTTTSDGGFYLFEDLDPGTYLLHEIQPSGVDDGEQILSSLGGTIPANDTMRLTLERIDATDYIFAELGQSVASGDTATIGFWQNKHGQELIIQGGTALADWLTDNFGNVFGDTFIGGGGDDVASFYRDQLFRQKSEKSAGPAKVDAQFMAVALATYFTSGNLAGNVASDYGFNVTDTGIGTKIVNVGDNGAAFGVANGSDLTIMQLLLATNDLTDQPDHLSSFARVYDLNGDGEIDKSEATLRARANEVYTAINEQGDI